MSDRHKRKQVGRLISKIAHTGLLGTSSGRVQKRIDFPKKKPSNARNDQHASNGDVGVITNQFDTAVVYKRSQAKRKRRTAFKKFEAKVNKAIGHYDTGHNMITHEVMTPGVVAGQQSYGAIHLAGFYSDGNFSFNRNDDIYQIYQLYFPSLTNSTYTKKLQVTHVVADCFIRNWDAANTAVFEVYEIVPKTDLPIAEGVTLELAFQYYSSANALSTTGTGMAVTPASSTLPTYNNTTVGTSPFDLPGMMRKWTVLEKRRYMLGPGETASWQVRQKLMKKPMNALEAKVGTQTFRKGISKVFFVISYGIGTDSGNTSSASFPATNWDMGAVKHYKIVEHTYQNNNERDTAEFKGRYVQ